MQESRTIVVEHSSYGYKDAGPNCAHARLMPLVKKKIHELSQGRPINILDIGCGNGYVAGQLSQQGHFVNAVDISEDGIKLGRVTYPEVRFERYSLYDERLYRIFDGLADCVISLEVVEHLFYPRRLFECSYRILRPGGYLIASTPYHGYFKNLCISLVNGWDRHFNVEWEGGHIKFFSKKTLRKMACDEGFMFSAFQGFGRLPGLWMGMLFVFKKP